MLNSRVAFYDHVGIPQKGTVVYCKPHRTEPGVFYLGISLDKVDLNTIDIDTDDGNSIKVGAYIRSDEVNPLIEGE